MAKDIEVIVLGCGGSGGTPLTTGFWGNCDPENPRNRRTRASVAVRTGRTCVMIDTGPDFREQTIRENITHIDAVLYTHSHSDHVNGIDDVRYAAIKQRILTENEVKIPLYADETALNDIKNRFFYMFTASSDGLYVPLVETNLIRDNSVIKIGDIAVQSFVQIHGYGRSLGFRVGDVTYSTDVSDLDKTALDIIKGTKTWIVDCGQYGADITTVHANYAKIMEWYEIIKPEKIYLTHLTPRNDYASINNETPDYIECAYDGLRIRTEANPF